MLYIHLDFWRRERLPTPVFWPGEFHGLYSPWGHKESDMTERLSLHFTSFRYFLDSTCDLTQYLSFSVWLIPTSIVFFRSIHIAEDGRFSSVFMAEWYSIAHMHTVSSPIHLLRDTWLLVLLWTLGYRYLFTLVFQITVFTLSEYIPSSRVAGSYV